MGKEGKGREATGIGVNSNASHHMGEPNDIFAIKAHCGEVYSTVQYFCSLPSQFDLLGCV